MPCSRCAAAYDRVVGTKAEWVELGAHPNRWWEAIHPDEEDGELFAGGAMGGMFCPWLPPMRGKVIRSLKDPAFAKSPCNFQACKWKGCCGNITYWDSDGNLWFRWGLTCGQADSQSQPDSQTHV